jgi:hypothetical protein
MAKMKYKAVLFIIKKMLWVTVLSVKLVKKQQFRGLERTKFYP